MAGRLSSGRRHGDLQLSAQIFAGDGFRYLHDLLRGTAGNDLSSVGAGTRADIHDIVSRQHGILVVLHDDQCVAEIPQTFQRIQQFVIVSLVQSDAGLIQDIAHSHQPGTDLSRQTDTLRLSARERRRRSGQGEIIQTDIHQEADPRLDFLQKLLSDELLLSGQGHGLQVFLQIPDGKIGHFVDILITDGHGKRLFLQSHALTFLTGGEAHEGFILLLHALGECLLVSALDIFQKSLECRGVDAAAALTLIIDIHLMPVRTMDQNLLHLLAVLTKGCLQIKAVLFSERTQNGVRKALGIHAGLPAGHGDRTLADAQRPVRDHQIYVELHLVA